jgi:hypothetical protein
VAYTARKEPIIENKEIMAVITESGSAKALQNKVHLGQAR